jgi:HAD superfamily hydrolase (TIGR01549 family)
VVFDLDGTLVDTGLDFDQMRREMQIEPGVPVLEALAAMDEPRASDCRRILDEHEQAGLARARLMPGVPAFLQALAERGVRQAVLTRNSRPVAEAVLERFGLRFDRVVGREDAPAKPDPRAICELCRTWALEPAEVAMLGDYKFDLLAGRAARVRTVLYLGQRRAEDLDYVALADRLLPSFAEADALLAWLAEPT